MERKVVYFDKEFEGQFGNCKLTHNRYIKCPRTFNKMNHQSSKYQARVLFSNIKRNFFQKVAFYTNQTLFLGWLFWKRNFWVSKPNTIFELTFLKMQLLDFKTKHYFWTDFFKNAIFGFQKLKQTGTYSLMRLEYFSPTYK